MSGIAHFINFILTIITGGFCRILESKERIVHTIQNEKGIA